MNAEKLAKDAVCFELRRRAAEEAGRREAAKKATLEWMKAPPTEEEVGCRTRIL